MNSTRNRLVYQSLPILSGIINMLYKTWSLFNLWDLSQNSPGYGPFKVRLYQVSHPGTVTIAFVNNTLLEYFILSIVSYSGCLGGFDHFASELVWNIIPLLCLFTILRSELSFSNLWFNKGIIPCWMCHHYLNIVSPLVIRSDTTHIYDLSKHQSLTIYAYVYMIVYDHS